MRATRDAECAFRVVISGFRHHHPGMVSELGLNIAGIVKVGDEGCVGRQSVEEAVIGELAWGLPWPVPTLHYPRSSPFDDLRGPAYRATGTRSM